MIYYYVYCLIDPRDGQPFYVGKGYKQRMYRHEGEVRSRKWNNKEKRDAAADLRVDIGGSGRNKNMRNRGLLQWKV